MVLLMPSWFRLSTLVLHLLASLKMPEITTPSTPHYVPAPRTQIQCTFDACDLNSGQYVVCSTNATVDYANLPIINLEMARTTEGRRVLAQQARDAMTEHGFFYVINHGLTQAQVGCRFTACHLAP